jgi:hypothetical protein
MDIATLVENDDILRPQTTFGYKKGWSAQPYDFPNSYINEPFPVKNWMPIDTYAEDVNKRFAERYGIK